MDFGAIRQQNIRANTELLKSLGFETPLIPPAKKNASPKSKKRKPVHFGKEYIERPRKVAKIAVEQPADTSGRRRSSRIAAAKPKPVSQLHTDLESESDDEDNPEYKNQEKLRRPRPQISIKRSNTEHVGNRLGKRKHNPKTFGAIPGIEVGTWWETRAECSTDAVHAPFVAGIAGSAQDGAYSVVLSGGYEDDVDLGYAFTYTGSGGRDLKGTKEKPKNLRTAPQSSDQTFDNPMNASLKRSAETKKPVRVVRGYKLDSEFAPQRGYRYDGLYTVEKAWLEPGLNPKGYKVCKFAFKRLSGQHPLATKRDEAETPEEEEGTEDDTFQQDGQDGVEENISEGENSNNIDNQEEEGDPHAEDGKTMSSDLAKDSEDKATVGDRFSDTKVAPVDVHIEEKDTLDKDPGVDNCDQQPNSINENTPSADTVKDRLLGENN